MDTLSFQYSISMLESLPLLTIFLLLIKFFRFLHVKSFIGLAPFTIHLCNLTKMKPATSLTGNDQYRLILRVQRNQNLVPCSSERAFYGLQGRNLNQAEFR